MAPPGKARLAALVVGSLVGRQRHSELLDAGQVLDDALAVMGSTCGCGGQSRCGFSRWIGLYSLPMATRRTCSPRNRRRLSHDA
jgi:hypothetical protein